MCGIFGAIGDATADVLSAGRDALLHRGPDGAGVWLDGADGLVHTRLKIIDLSEAAAQPMAGCADRVRLTYNGEIYNHRDLRRELEVLGHRFRSHSDGEVIVHGYEAWGPRVVERLDGMFALAIWDAPRRRLVLARDRSGKKPLFYTVSPDGRRLRFASEVKALVAAGHDDALDPAGLPMYLSWGWVPAPATLHRGVLQLPPASRLIHEPGRHAPTVDEYWRPSFLAPPLEVSDEEATTRVRALTIAAVERRLESDVPLGAFLSGGLDSTIVVGVMARELGRKVKSFSIAFSADPAFDETRYAREASAAFGTDHEEFDLGPSSVALIEELVWHHDGPFADAAALPTIVLSRLTRQHVTVALSGDGGDELFAGYLRFLAAEASERLPEAMRRGAGLAARLVPDGLPPHSLGARARRFLDGISLPLGDRVGQWAGLFALELGDLLRPEAARTLDVRGPLEWQRSFFEGPGSTLAHLLDHNFRTYLANTLQPKVDRCAAGVALEVRSPFLDTALTDYVGRLPDRLKRRGRTTKWILRRAFADLVPARIASRPKRGFGVPLAAWFRGELRDYLRDHLSSSARIGEFLRPEAVRRLVEEHLAARRDHSDRLFTLLTLEIWLRGLSARAAAPRAASAIS